MEKSIDMPARPFFDNPWKERYFEVCDECQELEIKCMKLRRRLCEMEHYCEQLQEALEKSLQREKKASEENIRLCGSKAEEEKANGQII